MPTIEQIQIGGEGRATLVRLLGFEPNTKGDVRRIDELDQLFGNFYGRTLVEIFICNIASHFELSDNSLAEDPEIIEMLDHHYGPFVLEGRELSLEGLLRHVYALEYPENPSQGNRDPFST